MSSVAARFLSNIVRYPPPKKCFYLNPMEHKPVPLLTGKEAEYMLALKQEFRGAMKRLPFYIKSAATLCSVNRMHIPGWKFVHT
uniref:Ribosomal protein S14 n=1 Tax=Denticeps clupeoides TaxID=299321 RepID=A0AAY4E046_9TELE